MDIESGKKSGLRRDAPTKDFFSAEANKGQDNEGSKKVNKDSYEKSKSNQLLFTDHLMKSLDKNKPDISSIPSDGEEEEVFILPNFFEGISKSNSKSVRTTSFKSVDIKISEEDVIGEAEGKVEDDYNFMQPPLGSGTYGTVFKAIHKETKVMRAIKQLKLSSFSDKSKEIFLKDFFILSKLNHPNIIKVFQYYIDSEHISIVSEYCGGGELFDSIIAQGKFSEEKAAEYITQLLGAISHCHDRKLVHCDLKPENIVFQKPGSDVLKVIDFGNSAFISEGKLTNRFGTVYYIAPEVLQGSYDEKCDIWSIGVILFILLCGKPPFNGRNDYEILSKVRKGMYNFDSPEWKNISPEVKNLITEMLTSDPEKRPSAKKALKHSWFSKVKESDLYINHPISSSSLKALKNFRAESKFQQAILYYILVNLATKEEMDTLSNEFMSIDTDFDGQITIDDLHKVYMKLGKDSLEAKSVSEKIMEANDLDGKGFINYSEFIMAAYVHRQYLTEDKLRMAFNSLDIKKDQIVTVDEIKQVFNKGVFKSVDEAVWASFLQDCLGSEKLEISFEDFKGMMHQLLKNDNITQSLSQIA